MKRNLRNLIDYGYHVEYRESVRVNRGRDGLFRLVSETETGESVQPVFQIQGETYPDDAGS